MVNRRLDRQPKFTRMSVTKAEPAQLVEQRIMTTELATSLTERLLTGLVSKDQTEEVEDDRYAHVVSRTQSRFASPLTSDQIFSLEIHPSGKSLAYSRADGSLTVWLMTGASFARSKKFYVADAVGPDKNVCCLSWNSDELNQLATVSSGSEILIWAVDERKRTLSKVRTISAGAKLKFHMCAYDPSGRWLVALAKSQELYLFDARKDHEIHAVTDLRQMVTNDSVECLAWNNLGTHLFLGFKSGKLALLQLCEPEGFKLSMCVDAHRGAICSMVVDPWGRFVATGGSDGVCAVWDISSNCCALVIDDFDSAIVSISIDHLGKCIALCTEKGDLKFCDLNTGRTLLSHKLTTSGPDTVVRFYPDKSWFILSSRSDILERHFTPNTYSDPVGLWKHGYEKPVSDARNRKPAKKQLKRSREHDKIDRSRMSKRDSAKGSRFSQKR